MAKNRYVNTAKWDDQWHRSIGIVGRGLFDYLLTNTQTNMLGVYPMTLPRMAFDTGIDESELKKLLEKFADDGKVFFEVCGGQSYIVMKNWLRYQKLGGKTAAGAAELFNDLPRTLREHLMTEGDPLWINLDYYLCKPFKYPIDSLSYTLSVFNLNSNLNLNLNPNRGDNKSYPQGSANGSSSYAKSMAYKKRMP